MEDQLRLICFRVKARSGIKSHRSGKCDISIRLTAFLVIGGHCCGDCTFQHLMNSFFLNKSLPVLEKITKQLIKSKKNYHWRSGHKQTTASISGRYLSIEATGLNTVSILLPATSFQRLNCKVCL